MKKYIIGVFLGVGLVLGGWLVAPQWLGSVVSANHVCGCAAGTCCGGIYYVGTPPNGVWWTSCCSAGKPKPPPPPPPPPCNPSCGGPRCGQGNGCGGRCSNKDNVWSACDPVTFTRTNKCKPTQACTGSITGTLFDASALNSCVGIGSAPKVVGVPVEASATLNHSTVYSSTTDGSGNYAAAGLKVPDIYDVTYTVGGGYEQAPKLLCDGGLSGISLATQSQSVVRRIGLWRIFGGWFQAQGGDVFGREGVSVTIPASCTAVDNLDTCNSFDFGGVTYTPLIANSTTGGGPGTPGVVSALNNGVALGDGTNAVASTTNARADSGYARREYGYGYFFSQTGKRPRAVWGGVGKPSGSSSGIYKSTGGNITIGSDWDVGGGGSDEIIVVVHDGDVTITSNINVELGSYLSIIASGSITFTDNVTQVEGVYVADNLAINSTGDTATEQRFVGEGTFIGWNSVTLSRDRGILNNSESSEFFMFRPDLVINAPDGMRNIRVTWQDVLP